MRQQVDELLCLVAIGLRGECPFSRFELAVAPCLQRRPVRGGGPRVVEQRYDTVKELLEGR